MNMTPAERRVAAEAFRRTGERPPQNRGNSIRTRWRKHLLTLSGLFLLFGAFPAVMFAYVRLPEGRHSTVALGLPALPLLWAGLVILRRAGLPVDSFIRERPYASASVIALMGFVCAIFAMALGIL